jgi:hypothetical protein
MENSSEFAFGHLSSRKFLEIDLLKWMAGGASDLNANG